MDKLVSPSLFLDAPIPYNVVIAVTVDRSPSSIVQKHLPVGVTDFNCFFEGKTNYISGLKL